MLLGNLWRYINYDININNEEAKIVNDLPFDHF